MKRLKAVPVVSGALVGVNVLVFLICHFSDALYRAGILSAYAVLEKGQYGRILWAMFLHSDIGHLFNNMVILFFLGAMIEKEVGHVKYGVLYFLSGIGGNLLSLLMKEVTGDMSGSIGASGAVFVVFMVILSLYNGFKGENIDNAAHVGGLAIGFGAAAVMCMIQRKMERKSHIDIQQNIPD